MSISAPTITVHAFPPDQRKWAEGVAHLMYPSVTTELKDILKTFRREDYHTLPTGFAAALACENVVIHRAGVLTRNEELVAAGRMWLLFKLTGSWQEGSSILVGLSTRGIPHFGLTCNHMLLVPAEYAGIISQLSPNLISRPPGWSTPVLAVQRASESCGSFADYMAEREHQAQQSRVIAEVAAETMVRCR